MDYTPYYFIALLAAFNILAHYRIKWLKEDFDKEVRYFNWAGQKFDEWKNITQNRMNGFMNRSHSDEIREAVKKIAEEMGLEAIAFDSDSGMFAEANHNAFHVNIPRYWAGRKFDAKVNAAIQNSGDPRMDHLVKTNPDLFLQRFNSGKVEITRATSAGEETIKGTIGKIDSSERGEVTFEIIAPEKGIIQVKHSEIINFKTK